MVRILTLYIWNFFYWSLLLLIYASKSGKICAFTDSLYHFQKIHLTPRRKICFPMCFHQFYSHWYRSSLPKQIYTHSDRIIPLFRASTLPINRGYDLLLTVPVLHLVTKYMITDSSTLLAAATYAEATTPTVAYHWKRLRWRVHITSKVNKATKILSKVNKGSKMRCLSFTSVPDNVCPMCPMRYQHGWILLSSRGLRWCMYSYCSGFLHCQWGESWNKRHACR